MTSTAQSLPTALLVVDVQQAFTAPLDPERPPVWNLDQTLTNIETLLRVARDCGADVIYVQHNSLSDPSLHRGAPGYEFDRRIAPQAMETIVSKEVCDVYAQTDLIGILKARGIAHYVTCGIQSDYCVDMATKGGLSRGITVTLAADAHTTWSNGVLSAEQIIAHHNQNVAHMSGPNAVVLVRPTAEIVFAPTPVPGRMPTAV